MILKRYYCQNCKEFKSRMQLKKITDVRSYFYQCRYCHSYDISESKDVMQATLIKLDELQKSVDRRFGDLEKKIEGYTESNEIKDIKSISSIKEAAMILCDSIDCSICPVNYKNHNSKNCYQSLAVWITKQGIDEVRSDEKEH